MMRLFTSVLSGAAVLALLLAASAFAADAAQPSASDAAAGAAKEPSAAEAAPAAPAKQPESPGAEAAPPAAEEEQPAQPILEVDPNDPFKAREPELKKEEVVLLREGRRLFDYAGRLARQGTLTLFIFESELKPMALLPGKPLERAEDLSDYGRRPLSFKLSGVVYEYRGRNYMLITESPRLSGEPGGTANPPAPAPQPAGSAAPAAKTDAEGEKKTQQPADETSRDAPPKPSEVAIPPAAAPSAAPVAPQPARPREAGAPSLLREGKWLMDCEGRIDRRDNKLVFIFDNGDPSVVLLPNKKLEHLEDLTDQGRNAVHFRISGLVTEYRGGNYLSLSKAVVIPRTLEKL